MASQKTDSGLTGISETYGGDGPIAGLEAVRSRVAWITLPPGGDQIVDPVVFSILGSCSWCHNEGMTRDARTARLRIVS